MAKKATKFSAGKSSISLDGADQIVAAATSLGIEAVAIERVPDAVAQARTFADQGDLVLVTGSLYVVGEARAASR